MGFAVVDASVIVAWLMKEARPAGFDRAMEAVFVQGGIVPTLFHVELANTLVLLERKGISMDDIRHLVAQVWNIPLDVDRRTTELALSRIMSVAVNHKLTAYDAAYLELAVRRACPIITLDAALAEAARREGLHVLPS